MTDVLIYGDTYRSPEIRHEVPLGVPDPFLYVEHNGRRHVQINSGEFPRLTELGDYELHSWEEFGFDDLVAQGVPRQDALREIVRRAVRRFGVTSAIVPETFPLRIADVLRSDGVELRPDGDFFSERRRVKNELELAGIRRAQCAAEAGMDAARELLRQARSIGDELFIEREPLTAARLKVAIGNALTSFDATCPEPIVSHGPQAAIGHHMGAGHLRAGESILIDLWPRESQSACYADMTRTYVVGHVCEELAEWFRLVKHALDRSFSEIRAGKAAQTIYDVACDIFEAAGQPTMRTKPAGTALQDGFRHSLGHGVGLEVHERPLLGRMSGDILRAGDVVTIEPGLYRQGFAGMRLEDLVLVTTDGAENLTRYPYDLVP